MTSDEYLGQYGYAKLMALFAIEVNRSLVLAHDAYQGSSMLTGARIDAGTNA